MTLTNFKCNHLMPLHFEGLILHTLNLVYLYPSFCTDFCHIHGKQMTSTRKNVKCELQLQHSYLKGLK